MVVVDQADVGCDHIHRDGDFAGDGLIAGLGVVAFVGNWADDTDTALADQIGCSALGQGSAQVVSDAVVFDDGAVAVGVAVQAFAVAVGGDVIAKQAGENDTVAELAGRAEQDDLFVHGRRGPLAVGTCSRGNPGEPAGGQRAGFHSHAWGLHLGFGDGAEADEVFDQAGEGGEVVHDFDGGVMGTEAHFR